MSRAFALSWRLEEVERKHYEKAIKRFKDSTDVAIALGVSERTFWYVLNKYPHLRALYNQVAPEKAKHGRKPEET